MICLHTPVYVLEEGFYSKKEDMCTLAHRCSCTYMHAYMLMHTLITRLHARERAQEGEKGGAGKGGVERDIARDSLRKRVLVGSAQGLPKYQILVQH